jgi:hypothetical protein
MGTWGPGNFENDAAVDMVEEVLKVATAEIEAFCASDRVGIEDLQDVAACVSIQLVLHEHCNGSAPKIEFARALREKILRIYDEQIGSLRPDADYKAKRRAILVQTLNSYETSAGD